MLLSAFLLSTLIGNAQTTVCLKNSSELFINAINLKYEVKTTNGNFILDAVKDGACFTLNFDNIDLSTVQDFTLIPERDIAPLNCVSTFDLVLMRRHILRLEEFQGTDLEYFSFLTAADVNGNGDITTFDLVQTRQLIMSVIADFPTNTSWNFYNLALVKEGIQSPNWLQNFQLFNGVSDLSFSSDQLDSQIDLLGVKTGDLNGACQ